MARTCGILGATLAALVLLAAMFPLKAIPQSAIPDLPGALILDGCPVVSPWPTLSTFAIYGIDSGSGDHNVHAVVTRCQADFEAIQVQTPDGNGGFCSPAIYTYPGCQPGNNRNPNYPGVGNNNCTNPNCNTTPESADIFHAPALLSTTTQPFLATCGGLEALVQFVEYNADYTYPGGTTDIPTPGDGSNLNPLLWSRVINVINGDAELSQADFGIPGAGIILVKGDLALTGYPTYNGLLLVVGSGNVTISGGGSGTVNGAIVLANTSTCTGPTDSPGPISFSHSGGGTFVLNYNSDAVNPALEAKRRRGQVTSE